MGASEASVCMLPAQPTNPGGLQEEETDRNLLGTCLELLSPIKLVCCLLITVIVVLSVALSVRNPEQIIERLFYASCPINWIGFGSKCFHFSEERRNWTHSHASCVAFEAQLAQFDSLEELKFLRRYAKSYDYWIGLCGQLSGQTWNWMNSTEYNNLIPIGGAGECAFLNENGISSSRDYIERKWICSKSNSYIIQCPTELSSGAFGDLLQQKTFLICGNTLEYVVTCLGPCAHFSQETETCRENIPPVMPIRLGCCCLLITVLTAAVVGLSVALSGTQ